MHLFAINMTTYKTKAVFSYGKRSTVTNCCTVSGGPATLPRSLAFRLPKTQARRICAANSLSSRLKMVQLLSSILSHYRPPPPPPHGILHTPILKYSAENSIHGHL